MGALRIFCVEDDPLLGEVLVNLFRRRGHDVQLAMHGVEAWGRLSVQWHAFDVILCDHQLPGMTGAALVARLRQAGYVGRVVIYSSSLTADVVSEYRRLGVAACVAKSSRPEPLIQVVEAADAYGG